MKCLVAILLLVCAGESLKASVREGNFNSRSRSYYSNGAISYCQHQLYTPSFPILSQWEENDLRFMRFDGLCDEGFGAGPRNYQGRSYYANQQHHYCQFPAYNAALPEASYAEAQQIFSGVYDGYCTN